MAIELVMALDIMIVICKMCRNLSKNLMICVSFDEFVIPQVVHDDWDYKVKVIITDKRISIN